MSLRELDSGSCNPLFVITRSGLNAPYKRRVVYGKTRDEGEGQSLKVPDLLPTVNSKEVYVSIPQSKLDILLKKAGLSIDNLLTNINLALLVQEFD